MKICKKIKKHKLLLLITSVLLIYITAEIAIYFGFKDWTERGTFGDSFGAINALFSGLAFSGLIFTIYLQREELGLQREELKMTREELKGQKEEFHIQNETLKIQRFENTFFQLLALHHQIVNGINFIDKFNKKTTITQPETPDILHGLPLFVKEKKEEKKEESERIINGRAVFELRYNEIINTLELTKDMNEINELYFDCYSDFQNDAGHYFRNLYRIIKFIDKSNLTFDEKYSYTSMVRSQLSDFELLWLFYNCLSNNGSEKFKPLIEQYTLFKNINIKYLANINHKILYNNRAFIKPSLLCDKSQTNN